MTRPVGETWERVQLASARIPFRVKVAAVWVVLFAVLAFFGNAAGFDTDWMRDNFCFIAGACATRCSWRSGGIVLAIVLALLGALARLSRNPIAYGVAGFYVSFFRGTPLIVQMFLLYLALPQIGQQPGRRSTPGCPRASTRRSSSTPRPPASSRSASTTAPT